MNAHEKYALQIKAFDVMQERLELDKHETLPKAEIFERTRNNARQLLDEIGNSGLNMLTFAQELSDLESALDSAEDIAAMADAGIGLSDKLVELYGERENHHLEEHIEVVFLTMYMLKNYYLKGVGKGAGD